MIPVQAVASFRRRIVRPALEAIDLHSPAAENLVVGTALAESRFVFVEQIGGGPALGLWQMEPATFAWLWNDYLERCSGLQAKVQRLLAPVPDPVDQLATNPIFAAAMCRIRYKVAPEPLPEADDVEALGRYWKRVYYTFEGRGTAERWARIYREGHGR